MVLKEEGVVVKLEMAFDKVDWDFFFGENIDRMGFGTTWIKWIEGCISLKRNVLLSMESLRVKFFL